MLRNALNLAAILALASCSLQLDSQYGLRLGPAAVKRDVPGGKLANPEQIELLESENSNSINDYHYCYFTLSYHHYFCKKY